MRTSREAPNPVCTEDSDLPPPPPVGEDHDPARPHPDEPGADGILTVGPASGRLDPMPQAGVARQTS